MTRRPLIILQVAVGLMVVCSVVLANEKLTRAEAEARLNQLESEISTLQSGLESARSTLTDEQQALKRAVLAIQANTLELRKLQQTRLEHERELSDLQAEQQDYLNSLEDRRKILADQILAAYRLGRESRLKLVLNQDSPALLSRTLAYYDYFSRSQTSRIVELRQVVKTLDRMQAKISVELSALDEVQSKQQRVLDEMTVQRNQRQVIIDELAGRIVTDEAQLEELQANLRDLESLIEQLSDALADIPTDLGERQGPADLKGNMPVPVKGRVKYAYGQPRSAGLRWLGWLIGATGGTEVKSIAYGRVAYSDWLRGYGLLIIIDHGDGFMSLYANNESLLHEVGDWVESGSTISTVGTSAMNGSGLYFEIRKDGKALDPAVWLKR